MSVRWLLQAAADVPEGSGWLSDAEALRLAKAPTQKRRDALRLGRFAAKRALLAWLGRELPLARLEISAAEDGAPEPRLDGALLPCTLSLSHRDGVALCAVAEDGARLGCDLERIEARAGSFAREWLGQEEYDALLALPAAAHDARVTLLWSAKESALKALRAGLRRDPRDVRVRLEGSPGDHGWGALVLACAADPAAGFPAPLVLGGVWRRLGSYVLTLAADPGTTTRSSRWITSSPLLKPRSAAISRVGRPWMRATSSLA